MSTIYKTIDELVSAVSNMNIADIRTVARSFGIVPRNRKRDDLIEAIVAIYNGEKEPEVPKKSGRPPKTGTRVEQEAPKVLDDLNPETVEDNVDPTLPRDGILEIAKDGYGFVRTHNYSNTPMRDYYVSANMITRMGLKSGDKLKVALRQYSDRQAPTAIFVKEINDQPCSAIRRTPFDSLEACFPNERINMHTDRSDYSLRVLDLVAPIGKGQRGLIVAPPKTGNNIT